MAASEIIRLVLKLRREGVKEIHLIGQNVNSYRPQTDTGLEDFQGATPFSRLLRAVAATGIERIKFTTSFPRDFHTDIVDAINENENLCNWVHLPVQSGSNNVLKLMRRGHTIDNYLKRVEKIRESNRKITLTTDIIVGFPGETDQDFQSKLSNLPEFANLIQAYMFKYSPRPGTPAFEMPNEISEKEKTARFLELEKTQKLNQFNSLQSQLNKQLEVLAEGYSAKSETILTGHSTCHRVVNFKGSATHLGKVVKIQIDECKTNTLFGKML